MIGGDINKALDAHDVKVELSSADNAADTFSIEYTDYLHTAVEFNTQLTPKHVTKRTPSLFQVSIRTAA